MISKLINNSPAYLEVSNGSYPYILNGSNSFNGQLRLKDNNLQVFSEGNWMDIEYSCTSTIKMSSYAEELLAWCHQTRVDEMQEKELHEKYPALKNAYEKYDMIKALVLSEEGSK